MLLSSFVYQHYVNDNLNITWLFAVGIIWNGLGQQNVLNYNAESQLVDLLFRDYDPGCRPVINAANTISVNVSISLIQIMDLVGYENLIFLFYLRT